MSCLNNVAIVGDVDAVNAVIRAAGGSPTDPDEYLDAKFTVENFICPSHITVPDGEEFSRNVIAWGTNHVHSPTSVQRYQAGPVHVAQWSFDSDDTAPDMVYAHIARTYPVTVYANWTSLATGCGVGRWRNDTLTCVDTNLPAYLYDTTTGLLVDPVGDVTVGGEAAWTHNLLPLHPNLVALTETGYAEQTVTADTYRRHINEKTGMTWLADLTTPHKFTEVRQEPSSDDVVGKAGVNGAGLESSMLDCSDTGRQTDNSR